jgi:hypothetical protein
MTKLNSDQEEIELFIDDYIQQIRLMSTMTDLQIKVVLKHLIEEDPEWFSLLRGRFRTKQLRKMKDIAKGVQQDIHGSIKDLARKVA